jgi:hypothetical protein
VDRRRTVGDELEMPPKSVWKIVKLLEKMCEEESANLRIDEASLYRHVREMLDLGREPSDLAPVEIVERHIEVILGIEWTVTGDNETTTGRLGSRTEIWAAAEWAWVLFRDFFGEYPPTGDEDVYAALIHAVPELRRSHVVERLPPLS